MPQVPKMPQMADGGEGTATAANIRKVQGEVVSWFDSGIRLDASDNMFRDAEAEGVVSPTVASVAAFEPVADSVAISNRVAVWNPKGVSNIKFCVPEYLKNSPSYLDGSLPGDIGFDPMCLASLSTGSGDVFVDINVLAELSSANARKERMLAMPITEQKRHLRWMREAELKHGRLAMLAAAGWPLAELTNERYLGVVTNGRAPSLFNGHLFDGANGFFLFLVFACSSYVEVATIGGVQAPKADTLPGDIGFDPLSLGACTDQPDAILRQDEVRLSEVKNGRLAMMAITGMAVQEFLWGNPVVKQTPWFF